MSDSVSPTILITGATSGIGYATAGNLLARGATVIVHGPTPRSVEQAADRLVTDGADAALVHTTVADFSRLAEVTAMAHEVRAGFAGIDALVNNAATAPPESRTLTSDVNELTFQVNYLAPYLLTRLLTPLLRAAQGRVIAVSSSLHRLGNINWADPQRRKHYTPVAAYAQSKLALSMFARAMAREQIDVTALSVHPGIVETGLLPIYSRIGGPVEQAALLLARLSWPTVEVVNGAYYEGPTPAAPAPLVDNQAAVARLWKLTTVLLGRDRFITGQAA